MRSRFEMLAVLVVAASLGACQLLNSETSNGVPPRVEEASPAPTIGQSLNPMVLPTNTAAAQPAPASKPTTAAAKPAATSTIASTLKNIQPSFTLKVTSPLDESVLNVNTVTVAGQTIPGAVVSVNDVLADVDANGKFQLSVSLDEGPNILEIVASDENGAELSSILRLIYEP